MSVIKLNVNLSKMKGAKTVKNEKTGDTWINASAAGMFISEKSGHVFLDATLLLKDDGEVDQYGNSGMITQEVSKEERQSGVKGAILGNAKIVGGTKDATAKNFPSKETAPTASAIDNDDDLPF